MSRDRQTWKASHSGIADVMGCNQHVQTNTFVEKDKSVFYVQSKILTIINFHLMLNWQTHFKCKLWMWLKQDRPWSWAQKMCDFQINHSIIYFCFLKSWRDFFFNDQPTWSISKSSLQSVAFPCIHTDDAERFCLNSWWHINMFKVKDLHPFLNINFALFPFPRICCFVAMVSHLVCLKFMQNRLYHVKLEEKSKICYFFSWQCFHLAA